LKPEWWGLPLVQEEKYQEKPVKREEKKNNNSDNFYYKNYNFVYFNLYVFRYQTGRQ
jgi:hypothetical protein